MNTTIRLFFNILFLSLIFLQGYSQSNNNKRYLSLSLGPAFPAGKYAATGVYDAAAGFARTGELIQVAYEQLLGKKIGFTVAAQAQQNSMKETYMGKRFVPVHTPVPLANNANWRFDKRSWLLGSLMAGGYGQFAAKNSRVAFTTNAMIGVVYASYPKMTGRSSNSDALVSSGIYTETNSKSATGFAWSFSGGVRYDLAKKMFLLTRLEYFGTSEIKFNNLTSTVRRNGPYNIPMYALSGGYFYTGNVIQKISSVNVHIGVGINL